MYVCSHSIGCSLIDAKIGAHSLVLSAQQLTHSFCKAEEWFIKWSHWDHLGASDVVAIISRVGFTTHVGHCKKAYLQKSPYVLSVQREIYHGRKAGFCHSLPYGSVCLSDASVRLAPASPLFFDESSFSFQLHACGICLICLPCVRELKMVSTVL